MIGHISIVVAAAVAFAFLTGRLGFNVKWWQNGNPTPATFLLIALALNYFALISTDTSVAFDSDSSNPTPGLTALGFALAGGLSLIAAAIVSSRSSPDQPAD